MPILIDLYGPVVLVAKRLQADETGTAPDRGLTSQAELDRFRRVRATVLVELNGLAALDAALVVGVTARVELDDAGTHATISISEYPSTRADKLSGETADPNGKFRRPVVPAT